MQRYINQIDVTPLGDVMLVLLVIMLTTATFISIGHMPVNLAKTKGIGTRSDAPFVITLTTYDMLIINDRAIPEGGFLGALRGESRESAVVVQADKVTLLEQSVPVVDEVRGFGFQQVSLEVIRL